MDLAAVMQRPHVRIVAATPIILLSCVLGCSPKPSSPQELAAFHAAGPVTPAVDVDRIIKAKATTGPYRVVPGDVLEVRVRPVRFGVPASAEGSSPLTSPVDYKVEVGDVLQLQMPAVLKAVGEVYSEEIVPYACRVGKNGRIWLPTAGEMPVAGKTLLEIEEAVVAAYFPKFVKTRPSVLARVTEHARAVEAGSGLFPKDAYVCRVSVAGSIRLPVGDVKVADKTLADVELAVERAYSPKYVAAPPAVLVTIEGYRTAGVTVVGGVEKPGKYNLRGDEMSLVGLLTKAGGIVPGGAGTVRVRHAGSFDPEDAETLALPFRDASVPFADVALKEGDVVEVVRLDTQVFTVLGLVQSPGTFPYPTDAHYNLAQAVAFAGGGDPVGDPRYVTVYRQDANGNLVAARFERGGNYLTEAANLPIRPGDIILVEQTFRTRTRQFFNNFFRTGFVIGATYRLGE